MLGIIKKQGEILGKLEKLNEKIVYKSDHRIVTEDFGKRIMRTKVNVTQIVYESEETEWVT